MKKVITLVSIFSLLLGIPGHTQTISAQKAKPGGTLGTGGLQTKWTVNPFDNHVFIENKGQFDGKINSGEKILYGIQYGKVSIFFTANKVVYRYDNTYYKQSATKNADPDDPKGLRHETHFLETQWQGANPSAYIQAGDERPDYYTYGVGKNGTIKTNIFRKITYKDLYPGIDVVYEFVNGKEGIEYSLIVHPGADLSNVKLNYKGAKKIARNAQGDLVINSSLDELIDHAPVTSYLNGGDIPFSNVINGTTESFQANANFDHSKTIVIDPWITDPLFANTDKAYDMSYDYFGNVYAYGGQGSFQLVQINKFGAIQWTYTGPGSDYGGFTTDKVTGTCYIGQGFSSGAVYKVDATGALKGTFGGDPTDLDEIWRMAFDPCNRNIVIAGGGTSGDHQAAVLDTDMSSFVDTVNILGAIGPFHDMALICIDPDGNHCYIASARSAGVDPLHFDNMLMRLPLPTLSPTQYEVHDSCHFIEVSSIHYVSTETNGMNGAAASPNWVYLYNSDTVRKYDKFTGANISDLPISPSLGDAFTYGGLDVDACDDLFIGVRDSLYIADPSYTYKAKMALPGTVFDVRLGQGNALYACGVGFVTEITNPVLPNLISSASGTPSSCSACNGTATVNINCGVSPYGFKWSDGNTNQTDTGLCPGVYTVTVTDAACPPHTQTTVVPVVGENGYSVTLSDTNPNCALKAGSATAHVTGGVSPYTYSWSNGTTTQTTTGLSAGTYVCIVTDNSGCKYEVGITLANPTSPDVKIFPKSDSLCLGNSVVLNATGAKVYKWSPGLGLSCNICSNPTATPTVTTIYTVVATDSIGCTATVNETIKVYPAPTPSIKGRDSVCAGFTDTLTAKGGSTYVWSNGATTSTIKYKVTNTTTVTVTAKNGFCTKDTSIVIHVVSPLAKIKFSTDSVCQGDSILLTGSGGLKYKWNTGSTATAIWVKPQKSTTYTLYAYEGTCKDSALQPIKITPTVSAALSVIHDTVCPHQSSVITAKGLGGKVLGYRWSTGETSSTITVNDTVTTTYTATVYGLCDSSKALMQVVVIPLPKPIISGPDWRCKGKHDTLTISSSTNPTKYLWDNGKTTTTFTTGAINADSLVTVTAYNSLGCSVTLVDTVYLRIPPNPKANPVAIFCAGQPITLTASATGTFQPFTYTWNTGQTGTSITIDPGPDSTTTYTVYASNGCIGSATTTAIPNIPVLNACCSQVLTNLADTTILVASGNSKSYQWEESPNKGTITCLNPPLCDSVRVIAPVTTTYTVIGTDSNGCQGEQILSIDIDIPCFDVRIPNVITPNSPGPLGLNGLFYIRTQNMDAWSLTIYDRWGKEMFHSTDPNQFWTGTTEGGGKAPDGVYYYIIDATCQNATYKKDGFVQVIR